MAKKKAKKKKKVTKKKSKKKVKKKPVKKKKAVKKKKVVRKKKSTKKKAQAAPQPIVIPGIEIGEVIHFFPHVMAAVVNLKKGELANGDHIHIKGHTTDFGETIKSMQIDRVPIDRARAGQEIGLLVKSRVRIGDTVYKD